MSGTQHIERIPSFDQARHDARIELFELGRGEHPGPLFEEGHARGRASSGSASAVRSRPRSSL
jgi:hypothetical protein